MTWLQVSILLFLVLDPPGNLPLVLAILRKLTPPEYRKVILREMAIAFGILLLFLFTGEAIFSYLHIEKETLTISGGIILFIISLRMIFRGSGEIFENSYGDSPILVPIAVPAIAGPSAITTVILLQSNPANSLPILLGALTAVCVVATAIFLLGQQLYRLLGPQGLNALDRFMG